MTLKSMLALACAASTLAACSSPPGVIHRTSTLGGRNILAVDANQRLVIEGEVDGRRVICAEPSPDSVAAHAAQLAATANASLTNPQGAPAGSGGASLAAGYSQTVASLAMRTQSIQVLRDGYYRLCEAHLNGLIDSYDYGLITAFIDEFIATVVAIEAIGGTVQVAPIAIYAGGDSKANKDEASVDGKPAQPVQFPAFTLDMSKVDKARAEVIKDILDRYYQRKEMFHALIVEKNRKRSG